MKKCGDFYALYSFVVLSEKHNFIKERAPFTPKNIKSRQFKGQAEFVIHENCVDAVDSIFLISMKLS